MTDTPPTPPTSSGLIVEPSVPPPKDIRHRFTSRAVFIWMSVITILLIAEAVFLFYKNVQLQSLVTAPKTYEECLNAAGSRVQESYPSTCITQNGKSFTQVLTDQQKRALQLPDLTADWKLYTDAKAGYSLKYPDSIFTYRNPKLDFFVSTAVPQGGNSPKFLGQNDVWLETGSSSGANLSSLDEYLTLPGQPIYPADAKKTPVTMAGVSGYVVDYRLPISAGDLVQYTKTGTILQNEKIYTVTLSSWSPDVLERNNELFTQILSTFKLLDTSPTTVTGIRTDICCGCPTRIPASQIGNDGWVVYEQGKNYRSQLPSQCKLVDCAPCPPLTTQPGN